MSSDLLLVTDLPGQLLVETAPNHDPVSVVVPPPEQVMPGWLLVTVHVELPVTRRGESVKVMASGVQVPQVCSPPQPFGTVPQALPEHAVALTDGVQPQTFAVPPPPQVWGDVQPPQSWVLLQPFATAPHLPEQAVAFTVGTQVHSVGAPLHSSLLAHALQLAASAQPLLRSVGTHLLPHFLVSAPHEPSTQLSP